MPARKSIMDHAFRSQVYLERLKAGMATRQETMLQQAARIITAELAIPLANNRAILQRALSSIRQQLSGVYTDWKSGVLSDMEDIAAQTIDEERQFITGLSPVVSFSAPSLTQVVAAYKVSPLSAKGIGGDGLLESMFDNMSNAQQDRIASVISNGFFQGQTNEQIRNAVLGTKGNGFRDGTLREIKDQADSIVRTGVQHIANVAREEAYSNNSDIVEKVEWVSTLDNRTSQLCRSMDGKVFAIGKGPRPPAHINCRSRTIPVLSSEFDYLTEGETRSARDPATGKTVRVDADLSYYEWLKKQPADYQKEILGATRYQLFEKSGMSATEFSRLQLDRAFRPLTIAQMRERNPIAFRKAGL